MSELYFINSEYINLLNIEIIYIKFSIFLNLFNTQSSGGAIYISTKN